MQGFEKQSGGQTNRTRGQKRGPRSERNLFGRLPRVHFGSEGFVEHIFTCPILSELSWKAAEIGCAFGKGTVLVMPF